MKAWGDREGRVGETVVLASPDGERLVSATIESYRPQGIITLLVEVHGTRWRYLFNRTSGERLRVEHAELPPSLDLVRHIDAVRDPRPEAQGVADAAE